MIKRVKLSSLPTPIEKAERLGGELGLELYIKRDDLLSLGGGGNKVRKLEYLLGDALYKGCKFVVTSGATHSNHARLTAAAASKLGLKPILVLWGEKRRLQGNLLLDRIFGAEVRLVGSREEASEVVDSVAKELGDRVYVIPPGGANAVGALGYLQAAYEIAAQEDSMGTVFDYLVVPTGTGATLAGLTMGSSVLGREWKLVGASVGFYREASRNVERLCDELESLLGVRAGRRSFELLDASYGGYGTISREVAKVIVKAARLEGILLDPVYTGKAMASLVEAAGSGFFEKGSRVLFLHTGGLPITFQYAEELAGTLPL